MYIALTYQFHEEDGQYVGVCKELGTATCGSTLDEAYGNLREAVAEHLEALEELGERERFFTSHNIRVFATPELQEERILVKLDPDLFLKQELLEV